ncbi:right-handed parallel beta-helix repeat-containing protein [Mariniflexile ostreae]|uniref:Right-handed parallel beta-helix repeat-containing protein n=1 Tax=Mariniflexile ostreae TaxID=1520892 RepID=A0ABV5FAP4_9FLAO
MQRTLYFFICLCFLLLWSSCRKDFEFSSSKGNLEFSRDTVYLDTVFSTLGSSTYTLKVYNNSSEDIIIPHVGLSLGEHSGYRLNVDGQSGKTFENVELLSKDSLFVFIETTVDIKTLPTTQPQFLYTDAITFDTGIKQQKVALVTLIKDAVFIYPNRDHTTKVIETLSLDMGGEIVDTELQGRELLPSELTFTNKKPYVIYGYAAVPHGETLTIDAGARIHFHNDSGLIVSEGASLQVNGSPSTNPDLLENEVIFEGDRLQPGFSDIPGQWGTIWLLKGSINHNINYATIKNASVGLLCDGNANNVNDKLTITNSQIYNSSNFGIMGRNSSITAENVIINNAGLSSFAGTFGGKYNFTHCTITNYWSNGFRQFPAVLLNNFNVNESNTATLAHLSQANFNNCIIYGNDTPEILLDKVEDETIAFNFKFTNCLIRMENSNGGLIGANYDVSNTAHYEQNIFNKDPDFKNANKNQLLIGAKSAAINKGNTSFSAQVPQDILGVNRVALPDIGSYQHVVFPNKN